MARLSGGIFSRASGQTQGLVFGAARTNRGKKVTVRELVIPANPRTPAQVTQRSRFEFSTSIVRGIGSDIWTFDWNRAIGELPGFQSLQSIFTKAVQDDAGTLATPPRTTLGSRHFPDSFSASIATDTLTITWSSELEGIAAAADQANIIVVATSPDTGETTRLIIVDQSALRSDGSLAIPAQGNVAGELQVGLYFSSDQVGLRSNEVRSEARWVEAA